MMVREVHWRRCGFQYTLVQTSLLSLILRIIEGPVFQLLTLHRYAEKGASCARLRIKCGCWPCGLSSPE